MTRTARDVLDQEFLSIRAKILEVAAFYDRLDSASAKSTPDVATQASATQAPGQQDPSQLAKLDLLHQGCQILTDEQQDKAARLQLLFSRDYQANWRDEFGL